MNAVVRSVVQQYEAEADRQQVTVHVCLPDDVPAIDGDHFALERVFANLLHNALKFTPGGGRITVDSGYDGSDVWVSITDTGPGIPPEELSSLFEKYQQAGRGRSQEGTGLGLFIVRALVEAHGGHVTIQSTPGQGACFSIFLPVASLSVRAAL
jgi:signal transduction histidine kinase